MKKTTVGDEPIALNISPQKRLIDLRKKTHS